eukprot:XP_794084.3 PREDICTED: uncharacterized protein LOC589347 [Strongylocentrotus purpuratus]
MRTLKIPGNIVSSETCSPSTLRKRSSIIDNVRQEVSGGREAADAQQQHEIAGNILGPQPLHIPSRDIMELKSFFSLSWRKLRRLKSWLKDRRISTGNEKEVRKLQDHAIKDNITGEWLPLQQGSSDTAIEIKETPVVAVNSLSALVQDLLEEYDQLGELTWHEDHIPEGEIWLKVGGDKGGGTFKMMIQVANVNRPNSLHNTRVIMLFPGSDSTFNLDVSLETIRCQIADLESMSWRGKTMKVFAFGDYEYLTRMYGLTGPNGRHCCLYCEMPKKDFADPPMTVPRQRSLQTLKESLSHFKTCGIPKESVNVIRDPFFDIPINRVCPPGLHISLGVFLKHFNSLCQACHTLDLKIGHSLARTPTDQLEAKEAFKQQLKKLNLQTRVKLAEEEVHDLMEQHMMVALLYPEAEPPTLILEMAEEKKREKAKLEKEIGKIPEMLAHSGPTNVGLEEALQQLRVSRQAYHGRSFVGNHVHKCLQPENTDVITATIAKTVQSLCPNDQDLIQEAEQIATKYNTLLKLFGACHRGINTGTFLDDSVIDKLDRDIKEYMSFYRQNFPTESVTPKQHLLQFHVIPWFRDWGASLGMMGEQGGESVHCQLNNISRDLRGYNDDLKLNIQCVKNQWILSSPSNYNKFS